MTLQPKNIGETVRLIREASGLGSIEKAAKTFGINKNTLAGYELGKFLPDIDFLVVFADKTGADFNELLRVRLASSRDEKVRGLQGRFVPQRAADSVADGIEKAIAHAGMSRAKAAAALGISEKQLALYLSGSVLPDWSFVQKVAEVTGYELDFLEDLLAFSRHAARQADNASPDFVEILPCAGQDVPRVLFEKEWLRREWNAAPEHLSMVVIPDESMRPTLDVGEMALVDHRDQGQARDGVYVLRIDGAPLVKRLQRLPGGIINVTSDNPAYKPFTVNLSDLRDNDFAIIGRVVWSGRRM